MVGGRHVLDFGDLLYHVRAEGFESLVALFGVGGGS